MIVATFGGAALPPPVLGNIRKCQSWTARPCLSPPALPVPDHYARGPTAYGLLRRSGVSWISRPADDGYDADVRSRPPLRRMLILGTGLASPNRALRALMLRRKTLKN